MHAKSDWLTTVTSSIIDSLHLIYKLKLNITKKRGLSQRSTSICGSAFLSLFFISRLPIPLLDRSSTFKDLLVLRQPTMPSTLFSVILFPCKSTCSIWVSHSALITWATPSSVNLFLANERDLMWPLWDLRHLDISPACISPKSRLY